MSFTSHTQVSRLLFSSLFHRVLLQSFFCCFHRIFSPCSVSCHHIRQRFLICTSQFLRQVPVGLMSGYLVARYLPEKGHKDGQTLWLIIALLTMYGYALLFTLPRELEALRFLNVASSESDSSHHFTSLELISSDTLSHLFDNSNGL